MLRSFSAKAPPGLLKIWRVCLVTCSGDLSAGPDFGATNIVNPLITAEGGSPSPLGFSEGRWSGMEDAAPTYGGLVKLIEMYQLPCSRTRQAEQPLAPGSTAELMRFKRGKDAGAVASFARGKT